MGMIWSSSYDRPRDADDVEALEEFVVALRDVLLVYS